MVKETIKPDLGVGAEVEMNAQASIGKRLNHRNLYRFECFDKDGELKWVEEVSNLVVDVGLNDSLDKHFKASAYTAAWYVGLKNTGAFAAGDTMSSHAGWTENTTYSNAARPTLTLGAVSGKSVDNSASKAVFNINGTTTIYGAFIVTDSTKGGTSGILYGGADFGTSRAVVSGDTLNVTITLTAG